jgi:N-acetylglucosamine-6-phosphate deacetylase
MKCTGRLASTGELVLVESDRIITHVDPWLTPQPDADWLAPGFIDLQINGFAGVDFNNPSVTACDLEGALSVIFSTGVTRFLPTIITGSPHGMLACIRNLTKFRTSLKFGEATEGFHIEGPHISPDDGPRGAHPKEWVRPPDVSEFERWQDASDRNIRLVTLSPEWPGATSYIEHLRGQGVVVSIGHTGATSAQIRDAVSAGATLSTHLGNGTHPVLPKTNNYLWDQLAEPRLAASLIVDGLHLPESFLRAALRAKGTDRCILVTDAVAPAMGKPGPYRLGEVETELLEDGRVVLKGGTRLAGSSLRMDRAIENVIRSGRVSLEEAIAMATTNAARVGRIGSRLRGVQPGDRADLVRFSFVDGRVEVKETYLSGQRVYGAT